MKTALLSSLLLSAVASGSCNFSRQCAALADTLTENLANTTISFSEYVHAGTNLSVPSTHPTCENVSGAFDFSFCRVGLTAHTGPESNVKLETWLPLNWTGRFLSVGNGGLGGCIGYSDMAYAVERGFAAVGTNNGHDGNTGLPFYNKPGVVEDFAYRAVHTGVVLGKQVTEALYGKKHTKSYYLGCSTGGRQGFMEAQRFPEDFDGIVAGAPAFDFTGLQSSSGWYYTIVGQPGSPTFLTRQLWQLVVQDTLKMCDGLDGHVDSVIEDPDLCQYRPERLLCSGNQTENCLTGVQAETVRRVYAPLYDKFGKLVYPRMQPGVESSGILWNGRPFAYALEWWQYVIYNDPSYAGNMTLDDIEAARNAETYGIDAFQGDLSGVKDRGTKILHYHGLQDNLITSDNSARYYDLVSRTMELTSEELDEFYRYFRISGMAHCAGGTGAQNIGNRAATLAGEDPEENVLSAIVQWVEEGKAPEHVLGTAFVDQTTKAQVPFEDEDLSDENDQGMISLLELESPLLHDVGDQVVQVYEQSDKPDNDPNLDPDYEFAIEARVVYSSKYHYYSKDDLAFGKMPRFVSNNSLKWDGLPITPKSSWVDILNCPPMGDEEYDTRKLIVPSLDQLKKCLELKPLALDNVKFLMVSKEIILDFAKEEKLPDIHPKAIDFNNEETFRAKIIGLYNAFYLRCALALAVLRTHELKKNWDLEKNAAWKMLDYLHEQKKQLLWEFNEQVPCEWDSKFTFTKVLEAELQKVASGWRRAFETYERLQKSEL
ncbi:putative feruloyl esterase B-1 [Paramyrothecium foliicola]|nr:putative feruloyl esterase B-1 [Paramyrothecium foliicola]